MSKNLALKWHTEQRKWCDLIPYKHNPMVMSAEQQRALEQSLMKFDVVEIPVINGDNTLIAGHQRAERMVLLGRGEETTDVRVPNRMLTEAELKEYNVASNAIKGDWVDNILREHYHDVDLASMGVNLQEIDAQLSEEAKTRERKPVYPIVAEFSEKYDAIVIVSENEIDTNFIKEVLKLATLQSYKNESIGQTNVIRAKEFIKLWKLKSSS